MHFLKEYLTGWRLNLIHILYFNRVCVSGLVAQDVLEAGGDVAKAGGEDKLQDVVYLGDACFAVVQGTLGL